MTSEPTSLGLKYAVPPSPTKIHNISMPGPFSDPTPPSSPSEDDMANPFNKTSVKKPVEFNPNPTSFKHYTSKSSFFPVNVNMNPVIDDLPVTADSVTPPHSPSLTPVQSDEEEDKPKPSVVIDAVPVFRHAAPMSRPSNININGGRRKFKPTPEPAVTKKEELLAPQKDVYLPPSPALTPSHSTSAAKIQGYTDILNNLENPNQPPTKHSHRCRLCGVWLQTRMGPGIGKPTHAVRMHMVRWHSSNLGISVCRDDIGARGVGEGWLY